MNLNCVESSDAITKHQWEVSMNTKLNKTSLASYVKKNSPVVNADLDMKGFAINNMKVTPVVMQVPLQENMLIERLVLKLIKLH